MLQECSSTPNLCDADQLALPHDNFVMRTLLETDWASWLTRVDVLARSSVGCRDPQALECVAESPGKSPVGLHDPSVEGRNF